LVKQWIGEGRAYKIQPKEKLVKKENPYEEKDFSFPLRKIPLRDFRI
jgi:hypothetical protein